MEEGGMLLTGLIWDYIRFVVLGVAVILFI